MPTLIPRSTLRHRPIGSDVKLTEPPRAPRASRTQNPVAESEYNDADGRSSCRETGKGSIIALATTPRAGWHWCRDDLRHCAGSRRPAAPRMDRNNPGRLALWTPTNLPGRRGSWSRR